jgi:hypothetical protein
MSQLLFVQIFKQRFVSREIRQPALQLQNLCEITGNYGLYLMVLLMAKDM